MKTIICLVICTLAALPAQSQDYLRLAGIWKVEGKAQYESWEIKGADKLVGKSYKLLNGQQKITETLSILIQEDVVIYQATVPSQNDGATISFVLNDEEKELLSFENLQHDFPKKIRYLFRTEDQIYVEVLGADDQGFSYLLNRQ